MKLLLIALNSAPWQGKAITISGSTFIIGRNPICHLRPSSTDVSRFHALLTCDRRRVYLRDLGTTSGTFLNEQQIQGDVKVRFGDRIRIGPLVFEVRMDNACHRAGAIRRPHRLAKSVEELAAAVLLEK